MDTGIGATLRDARNRRKLDLSEVEAAIKVRVRYLQAIENEEWDVLPGDVYARGFIRTYASYLGLDGERLADDFRRGAARPVAERVPKRIEPVPTSARGGGGPRIPGGILVAAVCLLLVAAVIAIGLADGGDGGSSGPASSHGQGGRHGSHDRGESTAAVSQPGVAMHLTATAEVWVCLLDAEEKPLVDGRILAEGAEEGPFRSEGFEIALGNGSVTMLVDGKRADVPASSSPVGYRIDSGGELVALQEGERPDCE